MLVGKIPGACSSVTLCIYDPIRQDDNNDTDDDGNNDDDVDDDDNDDDDANDL